MRAIFSSFKYVSYQIDCSCVEISLAVLRFILGFVAAAAIVEVMLVYI